MKNNISVNAGVPVPIICIASQTAADDAENVFSGVSQAAIGTTDGHSATPAHPSPGFAPGPPRPHGFCKLASWTSATGSFVVPIHRSCLYLNVVTILLEFENASPALTLCTALFSTVNGTERKEPDLSLLFILSSVIYLVKACPRQCQAPRHAVRMAGGHAGPRHPPGGSAAHRIHHPRLHRTPPRGTAASPSPPTQHLD